MLNTNIYKHIKACSYGGKFPMCLNDLDKSSFYTFKPLDLPEDITHLWPQVVYLYGQLAILQQMNNLF